MRVTVSPTLVATHPLFGLRVRTPTLELRWPTDDDLAELFAVARRGIHPAGEMPFGVAWTDGLADPDAGVRYLGHHWAARARIDRDAWQLHLAVYVDGAPVGGQSIAAEGFPVLRTVSTGSWLGRDHQGRGLGTEARAAVLELAFAGLQSRFATSSVFADNHASRRVSEKLGYELSGEDELAPRGVPRRHLQLRLSRERWQRASRQDVELHGVEACLPLLGA